MTPEDAKALRIAAATIRSANNPILADAFEDRRSYIERKRKRISALEIDEREKEQRLSIARDAYNGCRWALAKLAARSCCELLAARYIVEAVTASGHDLPALALELRDLLEKIGRPAWLDFISTSEAAGWQESAAAIIAAARPGGKATTTAQISTSTPAAAPNTIRHLNTSKTEQELRRIFAALVEAGCIAGADAAGASMLQPFLDAFNSEAREQGRINWIRSKNGRGVDKAGICALLKLTLPNNFDTWKAAAAAIFGVEIGKHERERYWSHEDNEKRIDEIRDLMK